MGLLGVRDCIGDRVGLGEARGDLLVSMLQAETVEPLTSYKARQR